MEQASPQGPAVVQNLEQGAPARLPNVFAAPVAERLVREDVRFEAPFNPYAGLAESTRKFLRPEVAAAVTSV